jgi:5-oxopent-3-ene-1,2,5-tricarboxylate decarboxylase / 2-hydroxyhepta-2,4-diene-1,7-dioate isomerase
MSTKAKGPEPLPSHLVEQLKEVSSATVSANLYKMGYHFIFMAGVVPLRHGLKVMGQAVTLRYLPSREDHKVTPQSRPSYAQQAAIDSIQKGDVLVVEARGNLDTGIFGDIYASRIRSLGGAGVVTDGAIRDSPYLRSIDFPIFSAGVHGLFHGTQHWASDFNVPIACGNVLVEAGDVILGDDDGVVVIPRAIAQEVVEKSLEQEIRETFLRELIDKGEGLQRFDIDPFTPELQQRYEQWTKKNRTK